MATSQDVVAGFAIEALREDAARRAVPLPHLLHVSHRRARQDSEPSMREATLAWLAFLVERLAGTRYCCS